MSAFCSSVMDRMTTWRTPPVCLSVEGKQWRRGISDVNTHFIDLVSEKTRTSATAVSE